MQEAPDHFLEVAYRIGQRLEREEINFFTDRTGMETDNLVEVIEQRESEEFRRFLFGEETPPDARAITIVSPEQLTEVNKKVEDVRNAVFANGQHLPENDKWVEDGARTPEEFADLYTQTTGNTVYLADRNKPTSAGALGGARLLMIGSNYSPYLRQVKVNLGFDHVFNLEMDYSDSLVENKRTSHRYNSGKKPMNEMTEEEYVVINHLLDAYLVPQPNTPTTT